MRRGRRGRPHLLCPPCPPIGRCGGQGAGTSLKADTSPGAKQCDSLQGKAVSVQPGRCAAPRSSSGCQPRARRSHGRPAPALRAPSGTEKLGHRSTRGTRSQDRCRQAVLGCGSHNSAKPVSSVRLRGISTVQSHRLCVPRICFNQSYREPKQGRRHCVAHLLGGVQPIRACRVLQRSTPVLVPFLLRGQVRLPVVLHDSRTVERGSHVVSPHHTPTVSKASRGRGQRSERLQRASPGRSSRNNPGWQSKRDPAPEGQVKSPPSPSADLRAGQLKDTLYPKSSRDSSTDFPGQNPTVPSAPSKPAPGNSSRTTLGQSQPQSQATGSATGSKLPGKSQAQSWSRVPWSKSNSSGHLQASGQQGPQPSITSLGPSEPGHQSSASGSGLVQRPSTSSSQGPPTVPSPSGTTIPVQPPNNTPNGLEELAPKASKSSKHQQKKSSTQPPISTSVPELHVSCLSESPLEYTSESTTEVTCSWPNHHPWLRYLQHCWRLKHLAC